MKKSPAQIQFLQRRKVSQKELAVYSRELSVMIDAELPLIQSLEIISGQTKNKYFKKAIEQISEELKAGSQLHQAKRKFPRIFNTLYCNLILSGEQSGDLNVMLNRIADYLENNIKLLSTVRQAMVYPIVILGVAVLVIIFMMWKVVPIFSSIFMEFEADLPFLTSAILSASQFVQGNIIFIFFGILALFFFFRFFKKTAGGRKTLDMLSLKIPVFGGVLKKVGLSRVTRTMNTLIVGGVPLLESLDITSSTAGNVVLEKKILEARSLISVGSSLTDAFNQVGGFPVLFLRLISLGEATGTLESALKRLTSYYEDAVEASVSTLLSFLEPLLLVLVGGIVGTIVISLYLPMFNLMQQI
ncbi:MAG: type II secretion system F family protein [Candidatus Aminicenantes bacterium]|nr:type II secretion system F family protein [Candidatus Aminicenantes bacterium]